MHSSKFTLLFLVLVSVSFLISCGGNESGPNASSDHNPPMEGFNLQDSDEKAIQIADNVVEAMGGRTNWDNTQYIRWNFFGKRELTWDKWNGNVRIEYPDIDATILLNVDGGAHEVLKDGKNLEHPDSLSKYYQMGKTIWINDSYWLVMPFKLKDTGVTLTYQGRDSTESGVLADILQLTFKDVGVSPQHKYHIYVDPSTNLVCEWAFFNTAEDEEPVFKTPWLNYQQHGSILLSSERGRNRVLKNINVYKTLPESVFVSTDPVNWTAFN